ncbi:protein lethal(2)essential for life-like [Anticarsia gemmatalis]|uniref:protein lethal(2)essential for life-like n=1 Tax=Anticarsia gemmatalis TaxID=129554 RepID=UPI003F76897A
MLQLPAIYKPPMFGDDTLLHSLDWIESFPWRHENTVKTDREKYEICLQVKDYAPNEISVKTADGWLVVEGKHEEKKDDFGYIARQFMRRCPIPEGCITEKINSKLTSDGLLIITVPRKPVAKNDTVIPVKHENSKAKSKL